mgnify:CR=1 FL=1
MSDLLKEHRLQEVLTEQIIRDVLTELLNRLINLRDERI